MKPGKKPSRAWAPILGLMVVMFLTMVMVDFYILRLERERNLEYMRTRLGREIALVGTYVTESILRREYSVVEQFVNQWVEKDAELVEMVLTAPNGAVLAQYRLPDPPKAVLEARYRLELGNKYLADLKMVKSIVAMRGGIGDLTKDLINQSLIATFLVGLLTYAVFSLMALRPLRREISLRETAEAGLTKAKAGLEQEVAAQTEQLRSANEQLVAQVEEKTRIERKLIETLRDKDTLLQEVHHRVKNNLQAISGLLTLQSLHADEPKAREILHESEMRIQTMALIHQELYRSQNLDSINMKTYVMHLTERLLQSFGRTNGEVRTAFELKDCLLPVATVIPCGLLLNELITNALKHAFVGRNFGRLTVGFLPLELGEYMLSVEDDGVGMPPGLDIQRTSSLGMQLITVITQQLQGQISLRREGGTSFRIRLKEYREAGTSLY